MIEHEKMLERIDSLTEEVKTLKEMLSNEIKNHAATAALLIDLYKKTGVINE